MEPRKRILLVDDDDSDARLIIRHLERNDMPADVERVDGATSLAAALGNATWDLILLDYRIPGLDFGDVLKTVRSRAPEAPVVVVSGSIGELRAIELLREGVSDFVFKDNLNRLVPVLRRSLRDFEERRARQRADAEARESEARYHSLVEQLPQALFCLDLEGRIVFANRRYCEWVRRPLSELVGLRDLDLFPAELAEKYWADSRRVMETGQVFENVERHVTANGEEGFMHVLKSPLRAADGRIIGAQCMFWDVTARQRAAEALVASEERLRLAAEAAQMGFWERDLESGRLHWSPGEERLMGYEPGTFPGDFESFLALLHPDSRPVLAEARRKARDGDGEYQAELKFRLRDGRERWGLVRGRSVAGRDGKPRRMLGVELDITERKLAEEAAREVEVRMRSVENNLPGAAVYQLAQAPDGTCRYTHMSTGIERIFGISAEDVLADPHRFWDLVAEEDRARIDAAQEKSARDLTQFECEFRQRTVDGEVRWVTARSLPRRLPDGTIVWDGVVTDVTERKQQELQRELLATAIEQAAEAVVITDVQGGIRYVNPAFEAVTGYSRTEAIGLNPRVLKSGKHEPGFYQRMWQTLAAGETWRGRIVNRRKDGSLFEEEATISPVLDAWGRVTHFVAVKRDISREVALEAQFRQAQKMEAIGQLAGGVAHDFNNMLGVILMQAELGAFTDAVPRETAEALEEIQRAASRAANLTRQLLLFSRTQVIQLRTVDLNEVVTSLCRMLQRIVGEDVHLRLELHGAPLWAHADSGMLDQILLNLSVNARDAMPDGGRLLISTVPRTLGVEEARTRRNVEPGRYVGFRVTDSGCGIPAEVLPRIFEPFFTTKEPGQGTGLGLATVAGIVDRHRGWIDVSTAAGEGTTFEVFLPAKDVGQTESARAATQTRSVRGTETLLLVEDEREVRLAVRQILERHGYRVLEAGVGREALEMWGRSRDDIRLLLTDVVLPEGMDGRELAARIQAERPGVRVLFMSGYSPDLAGRQIVLQTGQRFLSKPVPGTLLLETIRQCLDE